MADLTIESIAEQENQVATTPFQIPGIQLKVDQNISGSSEHVRQSQNFWERENEVVRANLTSDVPLLQKVDRNLILIRENLEQKISKQIAPEETLRIVSEGEKHTVRIGIKRHNDYGYDDKMTLPFGELPYWPTAFQGTSPENNDTWITVTRVKERPPQFGSIAIDKTYLNIVDQTEDLNQAHEKRPHKRLAEVLKPLLREEEEKTISADEHLLAKIVLLPTEKVPGSGEAEVINEDGISFIKLIADLDNNQTMVLKIRIPSNFNLNEKKSRTELTQTLKMLTNSFGSN